MTALPLISWSQLTQWRAECYRRFGGIHQLPIRAVGSVIGELLKPDNCVLDIGAGVHKPFKQMLAQSGQEYFSLDSDPEGDFDFHSFDDIPQSQRFDLMVANQVLEHLTILETINMLSAAEKHLTIGGYLFASVPNMAHPVRYWADVTHVTFWSLNDLYSVFRNAGFYIYAMARYNKSALPRNPIKQFVVNVICEVFRMDWCDSLIIVGQKQAGELIDES